jgi:hypothetical protein
MSLLSWYILIGLCSSLYFESVGWFVTKYGKGEKVRKAADAWNQIGTLDRLIMFTVWPLSIIIFIVSLLKAYFK